MEVPGDVLEGLQGDKGTSILEHQEEPGVLPAAALEMKLTSLSSCPPSLHRPSGSHHRPGEQHGRRPAGPHLLGQRRDADAHGQPRQPLLPEGERSDGEERAGL